MLTYAVKVTTFKRKCGASFKSFHKNWHEMIQWLSVFVKNAAAVTWFSRKSVLYSSILLMASGAWLVVS